MKKTLSIIFALAMILCVSISVFALELDTAENAAEAAVATEEAVLNASGVTPSIPTYDATYGELIYYEAFDDNTWDKGYSIGSNAYFYGEGCTISVGDGYGIGGKATTLVIDNTYLTKLSKVTVFMDVKKAPGSAATGVNIWGDFGEGWPKFSVADVTEDAWTTKTATFSNITLTRNNGRVVAYFNLTGLYADNIRVYATHSVADKVRLAQNNDSVLYSVEGDTFTFPTISNAYANAWECKDAGLVFAPGDSAAKADVLGKTFVAVEATVYVDENLGELILMENFDDGTWDKCYTVGTNAFFYSNGGVAESGDYGIGKYPTVAQLDNLGTSAASKITVTFDYKFAPGKTKSTTDIWGSGLNAWGVALPSGGSETEWTKFSKTLSNASFGQYTEICLGLADLYVDNIAVYAVYNHNTGARFVESKFAPSTVVVPEGDTYTFGAPKNFMYNAWTDGEKTYLAGSKIASSEIIGKLYYPVAVAYAEYTPKTEDTVEFRVNGNSAKNGIRFKASIAPSKKEAAAEMGFIAARADVLSDMGEELTLDLPAEGTVFVRGVAYDKNGKNIIYGVNDDGTAEIFTAVCVGLDITNKAHVTTELSARPYMTVSISEGNDITVYGEVKTASYYGVANALKTAADNGDEAAKTLYEGAAYEGGNYIDDIITTATAE